MKNSFNKLSWPVSICVVAVAALVMAAHILPTQAVPRTTRVGPEVKASGLTVAEQAARKRELHREISALMPPGVDRAPLRVEITQKDRDDLLVRAPSGTAPLRVGVVKPVPHPVGKPFAKAFNHGVIKKTPDGGFVWAMTVTSPGAQAIRIHFTGFSLPDNTEMYLLGTNGQAHGPYTEVGRNGNGDFWTRSILSDTGRVVLRYTGGTPDIDQPEMSFTIAEVGHIRGRPPRPREKDYDEWPCADNVDCLIDVNCTNTGPAGPAEDAVAKMEWISGPWIYTCTGGLLADTNPLTQVPYFLTANHCLSADNPTLETFFNYTTDSCEGVCPDTIVSGGTPPPASTVGVTVMATGSAGDYTLLTLDEDPPAGAVFLGWNNTAIAFTNGANLYRISNPNFGPQVYSQHEVDSGSPTCTGWPRGERIYSKDVDGATMGGSSGAPVVNGASEVVGQLSGCCGYNCAEDCDSANNWTVDGALAFYWDSVAEFLDPQGGCDNDDTCEAGEDCNNCPNDCRAKTTGKPSNRFCCDGDQSDCGDPRCSEDGWSCGGGGGCTSDAECDDGAWCNGFETCEGGSCQPGTDPCPGLGCDEANDVCITCGGNKAPCDSNDDCCSGTCINGTCRGN